MRVLLALALCFEAAAADRFRDVRFRSDKASVGPKSEFQRVLQQAYPECEIDGAYRGAYTAPWQNEALLSLRCGESHADNYGSAALLRLSQGSWQFLWRKAGLIARNCQKLQNGRGTEELLCWDLYSGMGEREHSLYTVTIYEHTATQFTLVCLSDNTIPDAPGMDLAHSQHLVKMAATSREISAAIRIGSRPTSEQERHQRAIAHQELPVPTRLVSLRWTLQSGKPTPAPATDQVVRRLANQSPCPLGENR